MNAPADIHPRRPRIEDHALITGAGKFVDDVLSPNQAFAAFVRSPHAHARIVALDTEAARNAPGVLAVLTGKEIEAAGVGSVSRHPPMDGRNGAKLVRPFRPALAGERVMHVGDAVALVIAESRLAAMDAAELVEVQYEPLDAATDISAAIQEDAPQLWPDAPRNTALEWLAPNDESNLASVKQIIDGAAHVAHVRVVNQRLIVASMETRGATASYDAAADSYTLRACSQGANAVADQVCAIMDMPREKLRVFSEDVGGAFGMKTPAYPEYIALLVAAKHVGRPVHWMSTRSEAFLTDNQGRDNISEATLALDARGKFLALHVSHLAAAGAYMSSHGAHIQTNNFARCFPAMYDIPRIAVEVRCVFTNTTPLGPYRGAGRPEANYLLERVVEEAARVSAIDKVMLRRRNLISPKQIPYKTPFGTTFDSGEFSPVLDNTLALANWKGFAARRREAKKRGKLRGIGLSCFLEHSGGVPTEGASITFDDNMIRLGLGLHSTGQGHASVFSRLAAERVGIAVEQVSVRQGDTALGVAGYASVASRGAMTVSHATVTVVERMLEKAMKAASMLLEVSETDIAYRDGTFTVVGTDRRLSLFDVATRAKGLARKGAIAEELDTIISVDTPQAFPNGCHVAEVEIDPATGVVEVANFAAVDDCGAVLDHMIVEGQVHGALAQGLGQALMENAVYDKGSGQLVAGSFMDYAMPRAHHMPPVKDALHNVPAKTNPLGLKGAGESGTIGSLAAIMNAIADAIPDGRGNALDMPATPEKVWRACRGM
jgi:aerobic carbon-monoxide dehydrogenase large subunit